MPTGTPPTTKELQKKYKDNPYAKDRAFWGSYLDESTPWSGGRKVKDILYNVANQSKVNPALLYTSAMEEGLQLYKTHKDDASDAYVRWEAKNKDTAKNFPVDGFYNYGLDRFGESFDKLVKKGYLKEDFKNQFSAYDAVNEKKEKIKTAAFKSDEDALLAKSAMMRDAGDELDKYLTSKKVKLSSKAKDFFTLAAYNGGLGNAQKMIDSYNQKGYLKDDNFLKSDFKPASYAGIYDNVQKRLQNADILQSEGFFSDYKPTYATGGETKTNWSGLTDLFNSGAGIANSIIDLFENNPNALSKQPIVNTSTMRNTMSPYSKFAAGGETDDMGMDSGMYQQIQAMADEYGISVEELMQNLQNVDDADQGGDEQEEYDNPQEEGEEEYGSGGIHINPKNKGKFNALKKRTGKTTEELTHSKNPLTRKRAIFAQNAKKWHHAAGGEAGDDINVEGGESIEMPNGMSFEMRGASHENGGIDVNVPSGTKIFSDRITRDGESMKDRHVKRTKTMSRLEKMFAKDPFNTLLKNTIERTANNHQREEDEDMKMMKGIRAVQMASKQFATGGEADDPENPLIAYLQSLGQIPHVNGQIPYEIGQEPGRTKVSGVELPSRVNDFTGTNVDPTKRKPTQLDNNIGNIPEDISEMGDHLTTGDYVGMAGNIFNAIAPIVNTNNARKNTLPVINRYRGFGHDAITANDTAQTIAASTKATKKTDIATNANAAFKRNANSASSINTQRALDIATQMGVDKANAAAEDSFSNEMVGLLDRRGGLTNLRDKFEMSGEHQADVERQQNNDNYYSNMARNLVNLGTNVQGVGKSLNVSHANQVDEELLSQLSKYGLAFDEDGKLITK